jgi:polyhydroxyalkanoate synthesis regulator phasin
LVVPGLKGLSENGAKAPEVKITDFATVVKPEGRAAPRVDLSDVDFAKRLSSAVENVVADVASGRVSVEEANLRLGAIRDAVPDKTLFDKMLQSYRTPAEPPKAPTLDFTTAAKKAAEVVPAADSGKVPGYRAFIELADLRASVADKARFDSLFGAKLREYGDQYINWLLNSGLGKESAALQLAKYEEVLGRQFIEKYMPDYGKVLAEVESKLSQLKPVSPREAPVVRLTPEELYARAKSLFDDVVEGRMDFFKASEELYKMWRDAPPEVRGELEAVLNQLNKMYGEKYGVTLEPWRPSLLETVLRRAELFASDVRSAIGNVLEGFRRRWERGQAARLYEEAIDTVNKFRRGEISLEEAKRRLLDLAKRAEKADKELSDVFRKKAEELGREPVEEKPPQKQPEVRLPDDRDVEWIRRAEEEKRLRRELKEREEGGGGGQQQLLLLDKERPERTRVVYEWRWEVPRVTPLVKDSWQSAETWVVQVPDVYQVLTPEVRSALIETLETRQRPKETGATTTAPMTTVAAATQLRKPELLYTVTVKEFETPETRQRLIIPLSHIPTEIPELAPKFPIPDTSGTPKYTPQYESPPLTTTTTLPTYTVTTPTYPPITVPKISEIPTVGVQPAPTPDTVPQPTPLPPGWWRLLPPDSVAEGNEGAYKVQEGKKQVLALA